MRLALKLQNVMYFSKRQNFATFSFFVLFGFNFSHDIQLFSLPKYVLKNRILKAGFNPQLTIPNQVGNLANQNQVTMAFLKREFWNIYCHLLSTRHISALDTHFIFLVLISKRKFERQDVTAPLPAAFKYVGWAPGRWIIAVMNHQPSFSYNSCLKIDPLQE